MTSTFRLALLWPLAITCLSCSGPTTTSTAPVAVRLVDLFDAKRVQGSAKPATAVRPTIWRFDGAPPSPSPAKFAATRGWEAGPGVAGLTIKDGQLTGRATGEARAHSYRADIGSRCSGHASRDRGPDACVRWGEHFDPDVGSADRQPGRHIRGGTTTAMADAVAYPGGRRVPDLRADSAAAHRDLAHPTHRHPAD